MHRDRGERIEPGSQCGLPRHRHHPGNGRDGDGGHQDALHRHNGAADRDGEAGGRVHHGREVGEHERESRRCG